MEDEPDKADPPVSESGRGPGLAAREGMRAGAAAAELGYGCGLRQGEETRPAQERALQAGKRPAGPSGETGCAGGRERSTWAGSRRA